jgi:hypothetical protein
MSWVGTVMMTPNEPNGQSWWLQSADCRTRWIELFWDNDKICGKGGTRYIYLFVLKLLMWKWHVCWLLLIWRRIWDLSWIRTGHNVVRTRVRNNPNAIGDNLIFLFWLMWPFLGQVGDQNAYTHGTIFKTKDADKMQVNCLYQLTINCDLQIRKLGLMLKSCTFFFCSSYWCIELKPRNLETFLSNIWIAYRFCKELKPRKFPLKYLTVWTRI